MFFEISAKGVEDRTQETRSLSAITCPHCAVAFGEIAADRLPINKASECKKHLLRCGALAAGVCTNPVIRKRALPCVPEPVDEELRASGKNHADGVRGATRRSNEGLRGRVASPRRRCSTRTSGWRRWIGRFRR